MENTPKNSNAAGSAVPDQGSMSHSSVIPPEKKKEDQVMIDRKDLDKLFETIKDQGKKIEVLYDVADKGRLAKAMSGTNGESLIKTVKISRWDNGLIIVGWKLTHNQSEIINGRWIEKQDTMLVFSDGSMLEVPLLDFYRKVKKETAEIVSRTKKEIGGVETQILNLRMKDGLTFEIDAAFIN